MVTKIVRFVSRIAFVSTLAVSLGFGQNNVNEEQGLKPFDSQSGGDLDSVSLTNGGLTLRIPVVSFPQRGNVNLSFFLTYSTKGWYVKRTTNCGFNPNCTPTTVHYNWTPVRGFSGAHVVSNLDWFVQTKTTLDPSYYQSVIAPDGTAHLMGGSDSTATPTSPAYSLDATGMVLTAPPGASTGQTLIMSNGTQFSYANGAGSNLVMGIQPTSVTDANGNRITISSSGWTDTLGRVIPGSSGSAVPITPGVSTSDLSTCPSGTVSASVFSVPGPNGGTRTFKFCNSNVTLQTSFGQSGATEYGPTAVPLLTAIVLPDLTMWTLGYDSYGDVTLLTFPTGGAITYTYANRAIGCASDFTQTSRWVTSRTVDAADGSGGHQWKYAYASNFLTTTVTDPNNNDVVHTNTDLGNCHFYETQTQYFQGPASNGALLKTATAQYASNSSSFDVNGDPVPVNIVQKQSTLILPGGQSSKVVMTYDSGAFTETDGSPVVVGSLLQKDEYDFSGSLARSTINHYLWQDNGAYKSANLLALVTATTVQDGGGNQVAQSTAAYDQVAVAASGVAQSLVAPPAGGNLRGNRTTTSRWLNPGNTTISSLATYYDTGMPANTQDANGNVTSLGYSCAGAYQSQTTFPDTNGVHHITSGVYDCNTGLLTSFTDQNGQVFSYRYDSMLRLTEGDHPDQGSTKFFYPSPTTVERQRAIDSNRHDDYFVHFDGLGRTIQTQVITPGGTVLADTTYDFGGRVSTVSNAYYQGSNHSSDPTFGITQMQYDALGRLKQTTKPDGSIATTQYTDNCATATDEAGKQRKSCTDAFGQLVEVDEVNPGASATQATGWLAVSGAEQSATSQQGTSGMGSVTIDGVEMSTTVDPCYNPDVPPPSPTCPRTVYDTGSVSITVNGHSDSVSYGQSDTPATIASNLATTINNDGGAFVWANASGATVNLTARTTGSATNYSLSASSSTNDVNDFGGPSFTAGSSGANLTGGQNPSTSADSGTVSATINGTTYSVSYGAGDTTTTIASRLASAIGGGSLASASASGNTVDMSSKTAGTAGDYSLSGSFTWNTAQFKNPSFTTSTSGSALSGGADAGTINDNPYVTLYTHDTLGDLIDVNQEGDGSQAARVRSFTYDSLSRLLTATNPESGTIAYGYDSDGNMVSKKDARGLIITYHYDALNRLTAQSYSDSTPPTDYFYDQAVYFAVTNAVGRLVMETNDDPNHGAATNFSYDAVGRIVEQRDYTQSGWQPPFTAQYDLLGDKISLTYPSGRKISFNYNIGGQLDQVQFAQWNGTSSGYTYWAAADNNFYPAGTPKSVTLGNGVVQSFSLNSRLQLAENTVALPSVATYADLAYNYTPGANNGNIANLYDKLNSSRTQSFTYDALSRLTGATEGRWGASFVYDPWGNLLQQKISGATAGNLPLTIDTNNRITGAPAGCTSANAWCYDASGNLLNDSFHQYSYDIQSRRASVDNGSATYTYNSFGERVRKDVSGQPSIEYLYFGGKVGAEHDLSSGNWSDYIFAGGRRIVRADNFDNGLRIYGTRCSSCGTQYSLFYLGNAAGLANYTIRSGDKLDLDQYQTSGSHGGIVLAFTDGTNTNWNLKDQDGYFANDDGTQSTTHVRKMDLSAFAGKTIQAIALNQESDTAAGSFALIYEQAVLISADGTVQPLYTGESTSPVSSISASSGVTGTGSHIDVNQGKAIYPASTTTYHHTNQVNTSTLITAGSGWPVWQGTFLPFGEEFNPQVTANHYKFTGKERDAESNLDFFGARSYSSTLGRFVSADWSAVPVPVPYASLANPQTLNLYAYVANNPTGRVDTSGHCFTCIPGESGGAPTGDAGWGPDASRWAAQLAGGAVGAEGSSPSQDPTSTVIITTTLTGQSNLEEWLIPCSCFYADVQMDYPNGDIIQAHTTITLNTDPSIDALFTETFTWQHDTAVAPGSDIWHGYNWATPSILANALWTIDSFVISPETTGVADASVMRNVAVLGRLPDTASWKGIPFVDVYSVPEAAFSWEGNVEFLDDHEFFGMASPLTPENISGTGFGKELDWLGILPQ